jgi:hypothetical protein
MDAPRVQHTIKIHTKQVIQDFVRRPEALSLENFRGIEGEDYSVVFYGGFKEHSEAETEEDAFQVTDLLRLSFRAQNPRSDYFKYSDESKVIVLHERIVPYVGSMAQIRIFGAQVDEDGEKHHFVLPDDMQNRPEHGFFLGSVEEFGQAYMDLIRAFLEEAQRKGQEYGRSTFVSEIWIAFAREGRKLPIDQRYSTAPEEPSTQLELPVKKARKKQGKRSTFQKSSGKRRKPTKKSAKRRGKAAKTSTRVSKKRRKGRKRKG